MSALPTSKQPAAGPTRGSKPDPVTPFSQLKPITPTERLTKKRLQEFNSAGEPVIHLVRVPKPGTGLLRCGVSIYPQYRTWHAACESRAEPGVNCCCTEVKRKPLFESWRCKS